MKRIHVVMVWVFVFATLLCTGCSPDPTIVQIVLVEKETAIPALQPVATPAPSQLLSPIPAATTSPLPEVHNTPEPRPRDVPATPALSPAPTKQQPPAPATPTPWAFQIPPTALVTAAGSAAITPAPTASPVLPTATTTTPAPSPLPPTPSPTPLQQDPAYLLALEKHNETIQQLNDQLDLQLQAYSDTLDSLHLALLAHPEDAPLIQADIDSTLLAMDSLISHTRSLIDSLNSSFVYAGENN